MRKGLALALKTRDALGATEAKIVLIGRVGADLSAQKLRYSHMGFARRDNPQGQWIVTHMLNHCGRPDSGLFDEGLGNFFLDDPFAYETVIVVPSPALQEKLAGEMRSRLPEVLHVSSYSMIASPFSTRYQNSNQWVLELVAAAMANAGIASRSDAQRWLRESGYTPAEVRISPMQRVGAALFRTNVRFDDHNEREHASGRYRIVSVESVIDFVARLDTGAHRSSLNSTDPQVFPVLGGPIENHRTRCRCCASGVSCRSSARSFSARSTTMSTRTRWSSCSRFTRRRLPP